MQPPTRAAADFSSAGLTDLRVVLTRTHRQEWVRVVATVMKRFGDFHVAEDAAADAFATAAERWPMEGMPPNPGAWLTTTATRKAIDRIRRESARDEKHRGALVFAYDPEPVGVIDDDRLRMVFICAHPALSMKARVALTLRMVGGLTVTEIAGAFLVQETTMAARITRAKAKITAAGIPYRMPSADDLPSRVSGVLAVLFLIYNEGYLTSGSDAAPVREDLTGEAIRLARLLHQLLPADGEVTGLLALMLLTDARRAARVSAAGELVPLALQDREQWNAALIAEGHSLVRERLATGVAPGRYQLLAAINAVHTDGHATDWTQVVALYDQLSLIDPSPIVKLNRAVAVGEADGPELGLTAIEHLGAALVGYHAYHVARADLLRRLGRASASVEAYDVAITLARNTAEVDYLTRRRDELRPT